MTTRTVKTPKNLGKLPQKQLNKAVVVGTDKERILEDGSVVLGLNLTKKESKTMYEAALLENKLTLEDLAYQLKSNKKASFRQLVIGAFVLQALAELVEKETK